MATKKLLGEYQRVDRVAKDHRIELADALGVPAYPRSKENLWASLLGQVRAQTELLERLRQAQKEVRNGKG